MTRERSERIAQQLARSGLPRAYVIRERGLDEVRDVYARQIGKLAIIGKVPGLYIHGDAGPDKTTLMSACIAEWIRKDLSGRFISAIDLISDIQATYGDRAEFSRNDVVQPLIDVPCLGIDDLGKEKASEHTASVIYQILDGRYRRKVDGAVMPLFITSNYSPDELCSRFRDDAWGEPIVRRISEMTTAVKVGT